MSNFWQKRKIYPSITTVTDSNWKKKIEEVNRLKLKEVCLFLTCLEEKERKELYKLLEKTEIKKIPLVHIRSDMKVEELDYLKEKYNVGVFNTHSEKKYPLKYNLDKYRKNIFIENTSDSFDEEEIKNFAGICLDISHLEVEFYSRPEAYKSNAGIIKRFKCGCNHITGVKKEFLENLLKRHNKATDNIKKIHSHFMDNLSEFDYLKKYPAGYFSLIIAIETENSIKEQLKIKDYVVELLKDKND